MFYDRVLQANVSGELFNRCVKRQPEGLGVIRYDLCICCGLKGQETELKMCDEDGQVEGQSR